mgnify:CR=1 FL=1
MKNNDLHKLLINISQKFSQKEYEQAKTTLFAMLNGVTFGFDDLSPDFLRKADDIYFEYKNKKNKLIKSKFKKKTVNNCNIIQFSDYKRC